jgi:hypothetical protein
MIGLRLDKQLSCEYICSLIQKLISSHEKNNNLTNSVLTINITNIVDSPSNFGVNCIEYSNDSKGTIISVQ